MTQPQQMRDALERAVDNQAAQRMAAEETRRVPIAAPEEGVETPDTDVEP